MNILVIGLGSMGKRRIRLLKELYPECVIWGVDGREERCDEAKILFNIQCCRSIKDVTDPFMIDFAFVCTSPLSHSTIITECLLNKWNVFTELNLVSDGYRENIELAKKNGCVLFLSSTFFYREEIKYIKEQVIQNIKWNYIYHIGQYLPDWHPWEDYRDFFVGNKKTNGCREIMAIELPWITKVFGNVKAIHVLADKMTGLKIDYNDNYLIQIEHENGNKGTLIVDVVSPVAVRRLEVYTEKRYIRWSGTPESLYEYDQTDNQLKLVKLSEKEEHEEGYSAFVIKNAYKNEIQEFVNVVTNGKEQIYGLEEDFIILKLIDQIGA